MYGHSENACIIASKDLIITYSITNAVVSLKFADSECCMNKTKVLIKRSRYTIQISIFAHLALLNNTKDNAIIEVYASLCIAILRYACVMLR